MATLVLVLSLLQAAPPVTAEVRLLAEHTAAAPGQDIWIGVHFSMKPGWHIYWRNPGDSGEAPSMVWMLPDGFVAGDLHWPVPELIRVGPVVNYGYHGDVLLPLRLRVPANARPGDEAKITARIRYIACADVCVPGKAAPTVTVPIGAGGTSSAAPQFAKARERMPVEDPSFEASAWLTDRAVTLTIASPLVPEDVTFFPLEPGVIDDSAPRQAVRSPRGLELRFGRSNQLLKPPRHVSGVLLLPDGRGVSISAPVKEQGP